MKGLFFSMDLHVGHTRPALRCRKTSTIW